MCIAHGNIYIYLYTVYMSMYYGYVGYGQNSDYLLVFSMGYHFLLHLKTVGADDERNLRNKYTLKIIVEIINLFLNIYTYTEWIQQYFTTLRHSGATLMF